MTSVLRLSDNERTVLHAIELDARASYEELSRSVGLSRQTVRNVVVSLERQGILGGYRTITNLHALGFLSHGIHLRTRLGERAARRELVAFLKASREVYGIQSLGGSFDLMCGLSTRDILAFDSYLSQLLTRFSRVIASTAVTTRLEVNYLPRDYLVGSKARRKKQLARTTGGPIARRSLNEMEQKILSVVGEDARATPTELAARLGVRRATIYDAIARLERDKIILGYMAQVHAEKFGRLIYHLLVRCSQRNNEAHAAVVKFASAVPEVTFVVRTLGPWDYELVIEVRSHDDLGRLLDSLAAACGPYVADTTLLIAFDQFVKYSFHNW